MKNQNLLEMNKKWFRENLPRVAVKLDEVVDRDVQVHSFEDEAGWNLHVEKKGCFSFDLHSVYDREREYQVIAQEIQPEHRTVVLVGCVSIDCLHFLIKKYPNIKHLILVEPCIDVFKAFIGRWSIIEAFGVFPKLSLIIGETETTVKDWLNQALATGTMEDKKVAIVATVNYRWNFTSYIGVICKGIVSSIRFSRVNTNTMFAFRNYWLLNTWHNLQYGDAKMEDFIEAFRGKPAILVSAGPSLDKNIHLLKEASKKALIVAVGSAMTILDSKGIRPHFRMAIDPDVENEELFKDLGNDGVPLLYSDHLYYKVLPEYGGAKIQMNLQSNAQITDYLYKLCGIQRRAIPSGFSVANVAVGLLALWQCDPIVFVGQDLSYTDGRVHGEGAWDTDKGTVVVRNNILRKDVFGNDVYTDAQFEGMREQFERIIAVCPSVEFLNATEGGVPIKGAQNIALAEVISKWRDSLIDYEALIEGVIRELKEKGVQDSLRNTLHDGAVQFESELKNYLLDIEKSRKIIRRLLKKEQKLSEKENKQIVRVAHSFRNAKMYKIISPVFEENFRIRREGQLQQELNCEMPNLQTKVLFLEICDVEDYVRRFLQVINWYINEEEFKVVIGEREVENERKEDEE